MSTELHDHHHHHKHGGSLRHTLVHIGAFLVRFLLQWGVWIVGGLVTWKVVWSFPWLAVFVIVVIAASWFKFWWFYQRQTQAQDHARRIVRGLEAG